MKLRQRRSVLLPDPLGPMTTSTSPFRTHRSIPRRTCTSRASCPRWNHFVDPLGGDDIVRDRISGLPRPGHAPILVPNPSLRTRASAPGETPPPARWRPSRRSSSAAAAEINRIKKMYVTAVAV